MVHNEISGKPTLNDGNHYLVERYNNVVFTPASRDSLRDEPAVTWRGIGFGISKPTEGFSALPNVPEELRQIIHVNGGTATTGIFSGRIFLDDDFTEAAMEGELLRGYSLVHIASHFKFRPGNESNSFLLLGKGKSLTIAQIKVLPNIFNGVDLLTLSACNTATGSTGADGTEVEGFAVLAQRQGAKAVVASLWSVADASTRLLMQKFYERRTGPPPMSKSQALKEAQLRLLDGRIKGPDGKSYAHPYYWSPFILLGNWK